MPGNFFKNKVQTCRICTNKFAEVSQSRFRISQRQNLLLSLKRGWLLANGYWIYESFLNQVWLTSSLRRWSNFNTKETKSGRIIKDELKSAKVWVLRAHSHLRCSRNSFFTGPSSTTLTLLSDQNNGSNASTTTTSSSVSFVCSAHT